MQPISEPTLLGGRLSNSFGVLFSLGYNHVAVIGEKIRQSTANCEMALMSGRAGDKHIACFLPATAE